MAETLDNDEKELNFVEFRDRVLSAAVDSIEWVTAPIVHFYEGECVDHRTAILIQIADMRFLVTAAHALIAHQQAGRATQIVMPKRMAPPVPLHDEQFWSTEDPREDIAVTELRESTVAALGDNYRYLRLSDMMSRNDRRHGIGLYLLMGFPFATIGVEADGVKRAETWKYLTSEFHGDYSDIEEYDPNLHLILDYEKSTCNQVGKVVHPPGLSGCGIWFVGHPISHAFFNKDDFRLAGIQTAWHKSKQYAKGAWIDDVLLILWKYYPSTRNAMQLHGINF